MFAPCSSLRQRDVSRARTAKKGAPPRPLPFLFVDISLYPHSFLSRGTSAGQRAAPPRGGLSLYPPALYHSPHQSRTSPPPLGCNHRPAGNTKNRHEPHQAIPHRHKPHQAIQTPTHAHTHTLNDLEKLPLARPNKSSPREPRSVPLPTLSLTHTEAPQAPHTPKTHRQTKLRLAALFSFLSHT